MSATAFSMAVVVLAFALCTAEPAGLQSTLSRPRVTGINHVALRVGDAAAARRFYGEMLGLSLRSSPGATRSVYTIGARQHVVLESGLGSGGRLRPERPFDGAQGRSESVEGRGAKPPSESERGWGPASADDDERLSHLAFDTTDIAALAAYLTSRGVQVQPTNECGDGSIRVIDPDDHTIEFVQSRWPPDARAAEPGRALSGRLLHAGLIIRDEEAAHRFYRDTLGFSEIWRGGRKEGVTQWVNMRVPDGTDYLEYMLVTAPPDRRQRGVLHHMALVVPDIQAAWEEVGRRTPEAARPSLSRPQVGVNGRWQLNLFDPDGTRTELMEPFRVR